MNAKTDAFGRPNIIFLQDVLDAALRRRHDARDPADHRSLRRPSRRARLVRDRLSVRAGRRRRRRGADRRAARHRRRAARAREACARVRAAGGPRRRSRRRLRAADRASAPARDRHDLSGLDAPLRSHGGVSEQQVPLIANRAGRGAAARAPLAQLRRVRPRAQPPAMTRPVAMNMMTELKDVRHGARAAREDAHRRRAGRRRRARSRCAIRTPASVVGTVPKATRRRRPARVRHRPGLQADAHAPRPLPDPAPRPPRSSAAAPTRSPTSSPPSAGSARRTRSTKSAAPATCSSFAGNAALQRRRPDLLLRPHAARQEAQGLHAARAAAGRDHRDHAVQPPAEPGRAQGRAVDRDQQPDGAEAHRRRRR